MVMMFLNVYFGIIQFLCEILRSLSLSNLKAGAWNVYVKRGGIMQLLPLSCTHV